MEIETYYTPDGGHQDNVFKLSDSEKQNRVVDLIDVVKDQVRNRCSYTCTLNRLRRRKMFKDNER